MASSEKFCLRWNDFESSISGAFNDIRTEKDFLDVTLVCEDDHLEAHKLILSACSPWFRSVLRRSSHQHPLVYLKGIKQQEMMSVIQIMYCGEVSVAQEDLNTFLAVAEELQVKGLTQNQSNNSRETKKSHSNSSAQESHKRQQQQPHHSKKLKEDTAEANDDIEEIVPIKAEVSQAVDLDNSNVMAYDDASYAEYNEEYQAYGDAGQYADNSLVSEGNKGEFTIIIIYTNIR